MTTLINQKDDTEQINLLAAPSLVRAIEEAAEKLHMAKSEWIRHMLARAVRQPHLASMPRRPGNPTRRRNSS